MDWLEQIKQIRDEDATKQAQKNKVKQKPQVKSQGSIQLLHQVKAHELLRQVQKTLLNGSGMLDIFDRAGDYERVISLAWQGPISQARKPSPDDPEPYQYILIGVREGQVWVNDSPLPAATPEALKKTLVAACKNPKQEQPN